MTRWIAASAGALALALAFGIALPLGNEAAADGMPTKRVYYPPSKIRCVAPVGWFERSQTTWTCSAEEKCCYDRVLRKGHCLPASQRCF